MLIATYFMAFVLLLVLLLHSYMYIILHLLDWGGQYVVFPRRPYRDRFEDLWASRTDLRPWSERMATAQAALHARRKATLGM